MTPPGVAAGPRRSRRRPRGLRDQRGQAGLSVMEVMLTVVISTMLLIPVFAWMTIALRQQPVTSDGLVRIGSTGLLSAYLPKDIAVAGAAALDEDMADEVDINFEDCRGGAGEDGERQLVLVRRGLADPAAGTKIVYSVGEPSDGPADPDRRSIWRRECDAATGLGTVARELLEGVEAGSTTVTCPGDTGDPGEERCRQIELRSMPVADGGPSGDTLAGRDRREVVLRSSRRVDQAALDVAAVGNRVPVAKIKVLSQALRRPYEVVLSSAQSSDPDGSIVCYEWSFPTVAEGSEGEPERVVLEVPGAGPEPDAGWCPGGPGDPGTIAPSGDPQHQLRTLPTSGVYYVELTVTDDKGISSTTYKRVEVLAPDPVAAARVQALSSPAVAGSSMIEFAARWYSEEDGREIGSEHPDGVIAEYEWSISIDAGGADTTYVALRDSPAPWHMALPEHMTGTVTVVLTVSDLLGRTNSTVAAISLDPDPVPRVVPSDPLPPPGTHPGPTGLTVAAAEGEGSAGVAWNAVAGAQRYLVRHQYASAGCDRTVTRVVDVPADPLAPAGAVLFPSLCGSGSVAQVTVGAEIDGTVSWSGTIPVPVAAVAAPEGSGGLGG